MIGDINLDRDELRAKIERAIALSDEHREFAEWLMSLYGVTVLTLDVAPPQAIAWLHLEFDTWLRDAASN
jgi:hypothetical protein